MKSDAYSSGTEYAPDVSAAWDFYPNYGAQQRADKLDGSLFAVAVHEGDVTVVPEAEALAMVRADLGGVGFFVRRRNR